MATDRLNPFEPYENRPAGHEDQLTRALLIVLRLCPMAHASWLRLVAPELELSALPAATFETQKRNIPVKPDAEEVELISVFLAPEHPETAGVVKESDRNQVLDAIIDFEGQPVVVVENKIVVDSDFQALNVNTGSRIPIAEGQEAVVVRWRDLIEQFTNLLEKQLVGGGEQVLLRDFLTYVEDHFEDLGPYRILSLCNENPGRVDRRLRSVLQDASGHDAVIDKYGPTADFDSGNSEAVAARAYLNFWPGSTESGLISLSVYPADTLTQAKFLYEDEGKVATVLSLAAEEGWRLSPNFHFGHIQSGLCWTDSTIPAEEYVDYWVEEIQNAGAIKREDGAEYWANLVRTGIASESNEREFTNKFLESNIQKLYPRPGLKLERVWTLREAESLDSNGELVDEVKVALQKIKDSLQV